MITNADRFIAEKLAPLVDYLLAELGGRNFDALMQRLRDAIQNGHPVLAQGTLDLSTIADHVLSDAILAASRRRLEKAKQDNLQRRTDALPFVGAETHTQVTPTTDEAASIRVKNNLADLIHTPCSRCSNHQLVLWSKRTELLCENCFNAEEARSHLTPSSFQILFCPQLLPDGTWASGATFSFRILREFVEKCLRPKTAGGLQALLVGSPPAISELIELLESRLDPAFSKWFEALRQKRESIRQCRDELDRLNGAFRKLDRKMSLEKSQARQILKEEWEQVRARAAAKQAELQNLSQQIEHLEADDVSFPHHHPATVQRHAIERLRRDFAQWQKGELDFEFKTPVHRVYWNLLEPDGDSWPAVVRHYEYLQRTRSKRYELERLKQIHDLRPDVIYIGLAAFEGYVVFVFKKGDIAVLDCPQVGNALYVMEASKWKFFSQLSKTELLAQHQDQVRRIIHKQGWIRDLESMLGRNHNIGR